MYGRNWELPGFQAGLIRFVLAALGSSVRAQQISALPLQHCKGCCSTQTPGCGDQRFAELICSIANSMQQFAWLPKSGLLLSSRAKAGHAACSVQQGCLRAKHSCSACIGVCFAAGAWDAEQRRRDAHPALNISEGKLSAFTADSYFAIGIWLINKKRGGIRGVGG